MRELEERCEQPDSGVATGPVAESPCPAAAPANAWDADICRSLMDELWSLRRNMLQYEQTLAPRLAGISPAYQESARNLAHYLALRSDDRRPLQEKLAWMGLSSLGRSESHVLANLDKVLGILHRLTGLPWADRSSEEPTGINGSRELIDDHASALLGAPPPGRHVRIMVTLPSEVATDAALVRQLMAAGMDIARINCAHDGARDWEAMAAHVRQAAAQAGRPVRILMDLGGPKLRTGAIAPEAPVLKLRPTRDAFGRVVATAKVGLRPAGATQPVAGASAHLGVWTAAGCPG